MPNNKAGSALLARIAAAALKEFGQPDLYVAQTPPGMALGDAHLDLLEQLELDRLKDPASVARLVELSQIVDCIQSSEAILNTPARDPSYLSDLFPRVVNNVEFFSAPLGEAEQRHYEQAKTILFEEPPFLKTSAYQEFTLLRSELEKKEVMLLEMQQNLDSLDNLEEKEVLEEELAELSRITAQQKEALDALDRAHNFSEAESIVDRAEERIDQIPPSVRTTLDTLELFKITNPANNVTHVACSFFPSHLSEDNWIPLKLTRQDIAGGADTEESSGGDDDDIDDRDIESIELEIQTVVCERHWLWPALFKNRHWDWRVPSEPISTGKLEADNPGLIPGYIHGLIFARNLTVKCKASARPPANLSRVSARPTATFLMRAMKPIKTDLKPQKPAVAKAVSAHPANQVVPSARRSAVSATLVRSQPVGPAVVLKRPQPSVRSVGTVVASRPIAAIRPDTAAKPIAVLRPGILSKLTAKGRIVDPEGQGIYQASVTLSLERGRRRAVTGRDGVFTFTTLERGRYRVDVTKAGFATVRGSLSVPQNRSQTIRMRRNTTRRIRVRLMEQAHGEPQPFVGSARVLIQSGSHRRLATMDGRSEAIFAVPSDNLTVTVTTSAAQRISPSKANLRLHTSRDRLHTVTFTIHSAVTIVNPDPQVLGFVCRTLPRSPDPIER